MATESADAALRVENLNLHIGAGPDSIPVVEDVSFSIAPGEMVGLVGESGSGKSLTALAIMGLLPPAIRKVSGSISIDGESVTASTMDRRTRARSRKLAMVFQNPMTSLNPSHRIGHQVAEAVREHTPGISRRAAWQRAVELLDLVEIRSAERSAKLYPYQCSGGMRQRVVIAMAIACKPSVLLADEPTTALDVTVQKSVMELLKNLQEELNLAVLFISHDLGLVSGPCRRTMVMYAGQLVEEGPTTEVLTRPLHPYVSGLLRCIPTRALELGVLEPLPGRVPGPGEAGRACRFADRCQHAIEVCSTTPPPLEQADADRRSRCYRWMEMETLEHTQQLPAPADPSDVAGA